MLSRRNRTVAAIGAIAFLASGCADYMNRWDTVSFGAGSAPDANAGIQTIRPFPHEAWHQHIDTDGHVIERTMKDYRSGALSTSTDSSGGGGSSSLGNGSSSGMTSAK